MIENGLMKCNKDTSVEWQTLLITVIHALTEPDMSNQIIIIWDAKVKKTVFALLTLISFSYYAFNKSFNVFFWCI